MARMRVASLDDLAIGAMKSVSIDDVDILLVRLADGVHAVTDMCTHAYERLSAGWLEGDTICCPKHGGKFDTCTGRAIAFPAITSLEVFTVVVEGTDIFVDVDE